MPRRMGSATRIKAHTLKAETFFVENARAGGPEKKNGKNQKCCLSSHARRKPKRPPKAPQGFRDEENQARRAVCGCGGESVT